MIKIQILFLGPASDFAGVDSIEIELPDVSILSDLRRELGERFEHLKKALPTIRLAINETFENDEAVLKDGDEVALIPPVSGGSEGHIQNQNILIELCKYEIDVEQVRSFIIGDPKLGGIVTFEGATRVESNESHGRLVRLDYEAYEKMACKELTHLAKEAIKRWTAGKVAIVHRIGSVPPAQVSVMIAVACGHRKEAFEACQWIIDTLKKDVPIWKKDVYEDGHVHWVKSEHQPCSGQDY